MSPNLKEDVVSLQKKPFDYNKVWSVIYNFQKTNQFWNDLPDPPGQKNETFLYLLICSLKSMSKLQMMHVQPMILTKSFRTVYQLFCQMLEIQNFVIIEQHPDVIFLSFVEAQSIVCEMEFARVVFHICIKPPGTLWSPAKKPKTLSCAQ